MKIKVLYFDAYDRMYRSDAIWDRDGLRALTASMDEGGKKFRFSVRKSKRKLVVDHPKSSFAIATPVFPTSHWNARLVDQDVVLDTKTGEMGKVNIMAIPWRSRQRLNSLTIW